MDIYSEREKVMEIIFKTRKRKNKLFKLFKNIVEFVNMATKILYTQCERENLHQIITVEIDRIGEKRKREENET